MGSPKSLQNKLYSLWVIIETFLFRFVSQSFLLHLFLHDHHVEHLEASVKTLAGLGTGEDDAPLLVSPKLSERQGVDHLPLVESHGEVLLVGHDQQWCVILFLLITKSSM